MIGSRAIIKFFFIISIAVWLCLVSGVSDSFASVDEITSLPFVSQGVIPFPSRSGPFNPIKWNVEEFADGRVPFVLNPDGPPGVSVSLPDRDLIIEAVRASLQTWEDVATSNIAFEFQTPASPPALGRLDGTSLITFADPGDDLDFATIAATSIYALVNVGSASVGPVETFVDFPGEIIESDLVFNPIAPFAVDGNLGAFDVQGVATHELGHAIGRDHTAIITAAMFTVAERGNLRERELTSDEVGGLSAVYPNEPSFSQSFGSISGTVSSGTSTVLGAHVVAVDANGEPAVSALTFPNGTYTIVGLPPGQYKVYAEPTDGPVEADAYDLGVLFPFSPAFNTVLRNDLVTVEAGVEVEGVDFEVASPAPLNLSGITPFDANIFLAVAPVGLLAERGGALEAEFVGVGLREGITISFDGPGIGPAEVINFLPANPFSRFSSDSSVDFRITVSSDAPLGPRNAVVRSSQGMAILPGAITIVEQGSLPPPPPPPTSGGGPISPGQTVSGNLSTPGQRDLWTFDGAAGDVATISMSADSGSFLDTFLELLGPDGVQVTLDDDGGTGLNSLISGFRLPSAGAYTIVARGFSTSTGAYTLTLQLTPGGGVPPGAGGGPISPGQTVSGNLSAPGQRDLWTFDGAAGDVATISMSAASGSSLDTFLELLGPGGAQVTLDDDGGTGLNSLISGFRLPSAGAYTIVARGFSTSTGAYTLALQLTPAGGVPPGAGGGPISSGQTVSGNLSAPGQRDLWTFEGAAGDVATISMSAASGSPLDTFLELLGPDGVQVTLDDDGGTGLNSLISGFRLSSAGTYTIVARGFETSTGAYSLALTLQGSTPTGSSGSGLNAGLALRINDTLFAVGDTLNLDLNLLAGSQNRPVDLYVAVRLPDGSFLFMTQNIFNPFVIEFTPLMRDLVVQDTTLSIASAILPEGSQGDYTVVAALATAGSPLEIFNLVDIDRVDFVIE